MGKKYLANTEIVGIGCVVLVVAFVLIGAPFAFDLYVIMAIPAFVIAMVPLVTVGILLGKYFIRTRMGIWLGAVLGAIIGYFLFISLISKMSFD